MKYNNKGFTIIDVLITVLLMTILVSISFPVFDSYIKETHSNSLKMQLLDMSNDFDRIKRKNYTYRAVLKSDGTFNENIAELVYPRSNDNSHGSKRFDIYVSNVTDSTYKITAVPTELQGSDYGRIFLEFDGSTITGKYDSENNGSYKETWY